jgi:anaerobic magnesium-protoporphyrin IX monomethyl ester cyclase
MSLDILLVHPVFLSLDQAERELKSPYFPLGLLYLAAFLRERGLQVNIFDGTFLTGPDDFSTALDVNQPMAVGIGVVGPNRDMALKLGKLADDRGATVIMGGPDPTLAPEVYLEQPYVDFVVHHEGELTLAELLDNLKHRPYSTGWLVDMPGVAYRESICAIKVNPRRPYILNLDELPQPARDLIDLDHYLDVWRTQHGYSSLTISVSRGCPYGCQWCQDSVHGPEFRQRTPQSVVAEVKALMDRYDIDRLRLVDDVDGIDRQWLESWADCAAQNGADLPFEALNDLQREDIPMLDVRDTL